jgi:hypothetical protein
MLADLAPSIKSYLPLHEIILLEMIASPSASPGHSRVEGFSRICDMTLYMYQGMQSEESKQLFIYCLFTYCSCLRLWLWLCAIENWLRTRSLVMRMQWLAGIII